jgi:putative flippase GtrA
MKKYNGLLYLLAKKHVVKRKQFILYVVIGLSGVIIDYLAYAIGVKVLGLGFLIANFISISLGIINNFALNTRFNFKVKDRLLTRFALFYGVGLLGLILSEILLVLFHYELGFGLLIAKLLTLPFVLFGQYVLNKYYSFGSINQTMNHLKRFMYHWPGYVVAFIFLVCSLAFVKYIPANFNTSSPAYAPDEITHYDYNVQFLLDHKSLPVSGIDDLAAYKNCRNNPTAEVPCIYSYTFYPGASYLVNALSASTFSKATHITPQVASRFPSTFYGIVFVLCSYFSAFLITKRRYIATLLAVGVGLIPQYIFISSYTNLDAHSVAISGLLGLTLVIFLLNPQRKGAIPWLAVVAGGLLPLAKYNFFVLALPVALLILYYYQQHKISSKELLKFVAWALAAFMVLASFWYIRNDILYHDPLGQGFALKEMAKFHKLGTPEPLNLHGLASLNNLSFFSILYRSFYLTYGEMYYFLSDSSYAVPAALTILSAVYLVSRLAVAAKKLRLLIAATILYVIVLLTTLGEVIYNSLVYDFQAQGRYLFPILMPTVIFLAYCAKKDKDLEGLTILFATGTLFIFLSGVGLFIKVYMHG